jgi:hypothetical protein
MGEKQKSRSTPEFVAKLRVVKRREPGLAKAGRQDDESSSCFFTTSTSSRSAALSALVAQNQSRTTRRVMMSVCPRETGNRSRIANASPLEPTQPLSGISRKADTDLCSSLFRLLTIGF